MAGDRSRQGLLLSAFGASLLAVSVFLPWYALSVTAEGIAAIQRAGAQFAAQFGNAQLQGLLGGLHADLSPLAGHEIATVTAHQALSDISVVLLIVAGLVILFALSALASVEPLSSRALAGPIALLGAVALACVLYRLVHFPDPASGFLTLSLRGGAWLSLLGSLAILAGGVSSQGLGPRATPQSAIDDGWSRLSGWTPGT